MMSVREMKIKELLVVVLLVFVVVSCSKDSDPITPEDDVVPEVYSKIYGTTSEISLDGEFVLIKTNGTPDHKSAYYASNNALYEAYNGTTFGGGNFAKNPNEIAAQSLTFKIPLNPSEATNKSATSLGPIGVAINGVALYNQYAGPNNQALTGEINSFDQYYGHPTGTSQYHYHVEPIYLTTVKSSKSGLMGFLLDGFPVYGPEEEDGSKISSSDLDAYHGHTHVTADFPNGTYHYHFTSDAPYMNGNGYFGTPGTVTQ